MTSSTSAPVCFDPGRARHATRCVALADVLDLLPLTHAPERVEEYRRAMEAGALFPPVSVLSLFGRLVVADGHKRLTACRPLVDGTLVVEVWPFHRFLRDQASQVRANARKNAAILAHAFTDRREALRLLRSTAGHWRRVALSLRELSRGASRG